MSAEITLIDVRQPLAVRSGTSRKLLARKASEQAPLPPEPTIEDSFPPKAESTADAVSEVGSAALAS